MEVREATLHPRVWGRDEGSGLMAQAGAAPLLSRDTPQVQPFPVQHIQCPREPLLHSVWDGELVRSHRSRPGLREYNSFMFLLLVRNLGDRTPFRALRGAVSDLPQEEVEARSWSWFPGKGEAWPGLRCGQLWASLSNVLGPREAAGGWAGIPAGHRAQGREQGSQRDQWPQGTKETRPGLHLEGRCPRWGRWWELSY